MGEIADMMLDGTFCVECGVLLGDGSEGWGIPEYCASCAPHYSDDPDERPKGRPVDHYCAECDKGFRGGLALKQHNRDKHGITA